MKYARFENGYSVEQTNSIVGKDDADKFVEIKDELFCKRLVLDGGVAREMTETELESEANQIKTSNAASDVRFKRDALLLDSDKLVTLDRWERYTQSEKDNVSAYRQALRDITLQSGFPLDVVWPSL